ncbi:hypothetical protein [Litoribacter populi]|uniref:hypothetical protein n=1 Tax=Litoribacter populi TaxID=2598460 RepID=UPI0011804E66|nr:hypothetical protein [Litoribacter populi]
MKKLFLLSMATLLLAACSDEGITPQTSVVGNWELVEVRSSWTNEVTPSSALPYSNSYELKADGTFVKFNTHFGHDLTGTYEEEIAEFEENPDLMKIIILTFDRVTLEETLETDEAGNLITWNSDPHYFHIYSHDEKENLLFQSNGTITNSGRGIMDGPMYVYHRK